MPTTRQTRKGKKPYADFPLRLHATGQWCKKIRQKLHYFGVDPDAALRKYLEQRDDLQAGRTPRVQGEGLTVRELCNRFLTQKKTIVDSGTLILDEDGIYDPSHFNDRLLLGLKGTMSEAELHVLRARLQGGLINKARRGELNFLLPVGLVRTDRGGVALDPDQQVQQAMRLFFETFDRTGTALGVVRFFRQQHLQFPRRLQRGVRKGEIVWGELEHTFPLRFTPAKLAKRMRRFFNKSTPYSTNTPPVRSPASSMTKR